jgi:hypothetical protein
MQLDSRRSLALLIILLIALLPFRFGHAMNADESSLVHSFSGHPDMSDCGHSGQTEHSHDCGQHSPDETSFDDCCGDHCSSTHVFVASVFHLPFSTFQSLHPVFFQRLPESLAVAEYRPPITNS